MKRKGLIFSTVFLFALSLCLAYLQANSLSGSSLSLAGKANLLPAVQAGYSELSGMALSFAKGFAYFLNALSSVFSGSMLAALIVLGLVVEMATLYPAVNIQLKQKKIHLFHKKLIDRFHSGELSMGKAKRELDVLYSVNERIHARGAVLVSFQVIAFVAVFAGLYMLSLEPALLSGSFSAFSHALLAQPFSAVIPALVGMAYMLHSLIKISLKQKEDYISQRQVLVALGIALVLSIAIFSLAGSAPVLVSVYFLTQITFATMRYLIVDENAKAWGKLAQRDLIKLLRTSAVHKNKIQHASRKFNHFAFARHFNFHLLEEALSMSLVLVMTISVIG